MSDKIKKVIPNKTQHEQSIVQQKSGLAGMKDEV